MRYLPFYSKTPWVWFVIHNSNPIKITITRLANICCNWSKRPATTLAQHFDHQYHCCGLENIHMENKYWFWYELMYHPSLLANPLQRLGNFFLYWQLNGSKNVISSKWLLLNIKHQNHSQQKQFWRKEIN